MQRSTRFLLLVAALPVLAGGCISSGREQSSRGVPSPSFGLNSLPQQSEPPLENVADDGKFKSRTVATRTPATADLDSASEYPAGKKGALLVNWMGSRDNESAPRKPLPLSPGSTVADDDDQAEP